MANNSAITAQQRAALFGASTRQHYQMLGMKEVTGGAQSVVWRIPKSRLVAGMKLLVEGKIKTTGSAAVNIGKLDIYKVLRLVSVDFNNGFRPTVVSGYEHALINMLYPMPETVMAATDDSTLCKCPASIAASSSGSETAFSFTLDMPLTLNYRDPVGLVLAQNQETNIDLSVDVANPVAVINNKSGYTAEFTSLKITPMVMSYSIPSDSRAFPDMSVLKILDSRNETFTSGQSYIKLPTGMIYRKMILKFENEDGTPMSIDDITSNIDIVFNTADVPYTVSPKMLRAVNIQQSGVKFPDGVYFFSFDYQGVLGYGGSRDYIDSERITELAVRFNANKSGKLTVISEKISRLIAG